MGSIFDPPFTEITEVLDTDYVMIQRPSDTENPDKYAKVDYVRGKTKVLWTGPLSVAGVPTSLDVGEAFSDWDMVMVDCNILSDTATSSAQVRQISPISFISSVLVFLSSAGLTTFNRLSDTSFQISTKTASLSNISRIIGIKL